MTALRPSPTTPARSRAWRGLDAAASLKLPGGRAPDGATSLTLRPEHQPGQPAGPGQPAAPGRAGRPEREAESRPERAAAPWSARRALFAWGVGVFAYLISVFHRSSLGVAAVEAAERFHISAAVLATFSVAQLAMYAGMQVPVGMLLDRYGPRRMLATGAVLMACGQVGFALVTDVRMGIAARILIGAGDAMSYISVLRIISLWFPARRNPLMVQLTGVVGSVGSLASTLPLVVLLRDAGWTTTYLIAAGIGALVSVAVVTGLRARPPAPAPGPATAVDPGQTAGSMPPGGAVAVTGPAVATGSGPAAGSVRAAWSRAGTKLGMWSHFVTMFSSAVFGLLWGYPFLVDGQGVAPATAALLLSILNLGGIYSGPLIGQFCARLPYHRSTLVLGIVAASAAVWSAVLLWPGRAPLWLLVVLVLVLAVNGPGSAIGFDYARTFNPSREMGRASGIVNVGGFAASIALVIGVGVTLDLLTPGARTGGGTVHYPLSAYRWAFTLQYLLWALGAVMVWRYRRVARRELAAGRAARTQLAERAGHDAVGREQAAARTGIDQVPERAGLGLPPEPEPDQQRSVRATEPLPSILPSIPCGAVTAGSPGRPG